MVRKAPLILGVAILLAFCCTQPIQEVAELHHFPLDSTEGIIGVDHVSLDEETTSDGMGSLKIAVDGPTVVRLLEVTEIDLENARLTYQAKVRTEDVDGRVYLEMWCHFQGRGESFSRGLDNPLSGTTEWVTLETPFFLKKGENPDYVRLNLVVNGSGTTWIDDIRLIAGPLK
jgi:hypothetical protein